MARSKPKPKRGIPDFDEYGLSRLMARLQDPCAFCGSQSWMYLARVDIGMEEFLRYGCQHCKESYRAIPLDFLQTGDERKSWER